jgi:ABC-type branched-subunit amino acid transport system substrate-binding protein
MGQADENVIRIGATICSEGAFALVGIPYGTFYRAFIHYINEAPEYQRILQGRQLRYIIYDDKGDGAAGRALIERLIHDDRVHAFVGILGTWNLIAAKDLLETSGIPAVYFGTGSSAQVFEPAVGNQRFMMGVQPNYYTEGRLMYLRAATAFGDVRSIGVVHSTSDDGISFRRGIESQASLDTRPNRPQVIYQPISTHDAAAITPQIAAVQNTNVIIAAGNQAYFRAIYSAAYANSFARSIPVLTSYVNAMPGIIPPEAVRPDAAEIYSFSWVVLNESNPNTPDAQRRLKEVEEYVRVVDWAVSRGRIPASQREAFYYNAFSTSAYIAIKMFLTGLERLHDSGRPFTAENFLHVMENGGRAPVALSGSVDFSRGMRLGLDMLSFVKYVKPASNNPAEGYFLEIEPMASINDLFERLAQ